ncbi:hypothetical protein IMX07_11890 [bacterium]|nr:hypothetical protein [bacterium]
MTRSDALKILGLVRANWGSKMAVDTVVTAWWVEALANADFQHALAAVKELALSGEREPPTAGQVFVLARRRQMRETEFAKASAWRAQRATALSAPKAPTHPALREMIEKLSRRIEVRV